MQDLLKTIFGKTKVINYDVKEEFTEVKDWRNQEFDVVVSNEVFHSFRSHKLEELLKTIILPNTAFEITHRWSGIMGVGNQKTPIVKQLSENSYCGIRLGGMGVALGSLVGKELADLLD